MAEKILTKKAVVDEQDGNLCRPEKGVESPEDALAGALDIIAEVVSDDAKFEK